MHGIFSVFLPKEHLEKLRGAANEFDTNVAHVIRNTVVEFMLTHTPAEVVIEPVEIQKPLTSLTFPDGLQPWVESYSAEVPCTVPDLVRVAVADSISRDTVESD